MSSETSRTDPAKTVRRSRRLLGRLFLVVMGLAIGLGGVELLFRWFVPVTDVAVKMWDPLLGLRRAPDQSGRFITGKGFVDARFQFNRQGWNHPRDYTTSKPAGVLRVCVIGDSYVEALQVNPGEAMFSVAERRMNRPGRPVEWYAFGASGWGTAQEYECLRHYVLDYQPDVVIIVFVQNDPEDCSPYLNGIETYMPAYALDDSGGLVHFFPTQFEPSLVRKMMLRSALLRYLIDQKHVLARLRSGFAGAPHSAADAAAPLRERDSGLGSHEIAGISNMPIAERERRTWELIGKLLAAARDDCSRRGARLLVAFRGFAPEIEAARTGEAMSYPEKTADPFCLGSRVGRMGPEELEPLCKRLGIPYLDLTGPLRAMVRATGKSHVFPDDGHYNAAAHRAAGEALAAWVETILERRPTTSPAN